MTRTAWRISALVVSALSSIAWSTGPSDTPRAILAAAGHRSGQTIKVTLRDGGTRTVKLEGVGCPQAICSRTAIHAQAGKGSEVRAWFDGLASIQDTTAHDALFISKNGTRQRLSLLNDFRVLYLTGRLGGTERLDLSQVRSVEFAAALP